ncbi:MAG: response regulator [Gammaproteobacteria bacterium]|jgi:CheY-like chemotaxis protein|nr:response regulator [Gammaproteobacteria bacterium]
MQKRILLVEDNPGDAVLLKEAFITAGIDQNIEVATNGERALGVLSNYADLDADERADLVLLDLNLPGLDGKEVLNSIRSNHELHTLPVIVLSSSSAPSDITEAYDLKANAYVVKPTEMSGYLDLAKTLSEFWLDLARLPNH